MRLGDHIARDRTGVLSVVSIAGTVLFLMSLIAGSVLQLARLALHRHDWMVRAILVASAARCHIMLVRDQALQSTGALAVASFVTAGVLWFVPLPPSIAHPLPLTFDARVVAIVIGLWSVSGVIIGASGHQGLRRLLSRPAMEIDHASSSGARGSLFVAPLIGVTTVIAIVGAWAYLQLSTVRDTPAGIEQEDVIVTSVTWDAPLTMADAARAMARIEEAVRTVPDVIHVGAIDAVPFSTDYGGNVWFDFTGRHAQVEQKDVMNVRSVSPEYFETVGLTPLAGRMIDARDVAGSTPVVVVGEGTARALWPDRSAIGQALLLNGEWRRVVGVVNDVRVAGLDARAPLQAYVPLAQPLSGSSRVSGLHLLLKTRPSSVPPHRVLSTLVAQQQPQALVARMVPLGALVSRGLEEPRFRVAAGAIVAGFGFLASAGYLMGLVMLISRATRRDTAVRIALGATSSVVIRGIVCRVARLITCGVAAGVLVAWWMKQLVVGAGVSISQENEAALYAACAVWVYGVLVVTVMARGASEMNVAETLRHN